MNVTKEVITDLFPLFVANECSQDSRALVEQYLQENPDQAEELRRVMNTGWIWRKAGWWVTGTRTYNAARLQVCAPSR